MASRRSKGFSLKKQIMFCFLLYFLCGVRLGKAYVPPLWTPHSWKAKTPYQLPEYADKVALEEVVQSLSTQAPLIFAGEAETLKTHLSDVASGRRFLITGGDCVETFEDFSPTKIKEDLQLLMQMSLICGYEGGLPTLQIGRVAGQFAKPRSSPLESLSDGQIVPVYQGDNINDFSQDQRSPDPQRMLRAYHQSSQTLNLLRAFLQGGYTTVQNVKNWRLKKLESTTWYGNILRDIQQALAFFQTFPQGREMFCLDDYYTGHECLLLPYETALARKDSITDKYYGCSGHFLWVGERTRQLDSAQIEFLRGVHNPIGIKVSSRWDASELVELLNILDPMKEPGRITFITRMGHETIGQKLPPLISLVKETGRQVVWCCDPMHGNTFSVGGKKVRSFLHIQEELQSFFAIHRELKTIPGGVHLEMTSRNVTECIGGKVDGGILLDDVYTTTYESKCDPRLNGVQALELAFLIGKELRR